MTPEEAARKQVDHAVQDELMEAIWDAVAEVTTKYDKISLDSVISAIESLKTKYIINAAVTKTIAKIKEATMLSVEDQNG